MENYSYPTYPDSGNSSPRSREIEFENPPPWDDQQPLPANYKARFMCSYGGKIHPRHDNQLAYVGGETKIFAVERNIKFSPMISKLSALCETEVTFKYQLPGEDLDALISVTNDDDLEHMMHEYDRMYRASAKPARMRLFLFPVDPSPASFGSSDDKSDRDRFVEALNSGPVQEPVKPTPGNVDFLFGLEKGVPVHVPVQVQVPVQAPPPPVAIPDPVPEPRVASVHDDRVVGTDHLVNPVEIQRELQRLQISNQGQDTVFRRKSEDNAGIGGYGATAEYYAQKLPEKSAPVHMPASGAPPMGPQGGFWQERQIPASGFQPTTGGPVPEQQPVYVIPAPGGVYHAPPQMVRQVTNQVNQGYYTLPQRVGVGQDIYREQPVYNMVPQQSQPQPIPTSAPPAIQTQPQRVAVASSEGFGVVKQPSGGGGVPEQVAYGHVAYEGGVGRQVFYTAAGGMAVPTHSPYHPMAAVSADMRGGGGGAVLSQEGKVVTKVSQSSV